MKKILLTLLMCISTASAFAAGEREFQQGENAYVRGNHATAAQYWQKGCALDNGEACASLSNLYYEGEGVPQDYAQARQYAQKGCALNDGNACGNLGYLYEHGQGVPQNINQAVQYYQKSCDLGISEACQALKAAVEKQ